MRHTAALILVAATSFAAPVAAEIAPHPLGPDGRVLHVSFDPADVVRIHTLLRVNTAIELPRGERINQVLLGDSESFDVEVLSNRNVVSIKPVVARAASNMTIYTNRRAIAFYVTEGSRSQATFRVVIEPEDGPGPAPVVATGSRDTGYQLTADSAIRPRRVWNDGRNTFFEFDQDVRPSVFGINSEGFETTQNSATRGNVVKVTGIRSEYVVRIGEEFVCVRRSEGGTTTDPSQIAALASREF